MAPPQKGKQATKGAKQIVEENEATLSFYRYMIFGAAGGYLLLMNIASEGFQFWDIAFFLFGAAVLTGSIQFMRFMGKPRYSESTPPQLLDSGNDLNLPSGVAEQVKDVIIVTCVCQVFSYFSKYFWLLWLLIPLKGVYYSWTTVIAPWIFAPAPPAPANEEKKARKLDRKMRR